ncbi:MAG: DUF2339 domain-containing protein [Verrucomicrobiales bacterium]|jgi:uncharacterized membrane protein|nr:DUF2339 domain-containing protein [Verrucomicrobiales bacterium]
MKCPTCSTENGYNAICRQCGLNLQPFAALENLRRRVTQTRESVNQTLDELRDSIAQTETNLTAALTVKKSVTASAPPPLPAGEKIPPLAVAETPVAAASLSAKGKGPLSEVSIGMRWMLVTGVMCVVIAVALFLKTIFDGNLIGPAGRVALSYLAGFVLFGLGELFRRKKFDGFGLTLIGGGVAVLYAATYAGFALFHLISQPAAFLLMVVVTAFAGILSLACDNKWLAVVGILGGFLAPVLLGSGENNYHVLFSYLAILGGGVAWLAWHKGWRLLNWLGFVFTWAIFTGWHFEYYADALFWPALVYANIFFLVYAIAPFLFYFKNERGSGAGDFTISAVNSFIAFGFVYGMIKQHTDLPAAALASALYAGVFLLLAWQLHRRNPANRGGLVLPLALALLFLTVTVPILFSGFWIIIFWMAEGAAMLWAALRLSHNGLRWTSVLLMVGVLGKLIGHDYAALFGFDWLEFRIEPCTSLLVSRLVTVSVALAALFAAARMLRTRHADAGALFYVLSGATLFFALNVEVGSFFSGGARTAALSVLWALYSIALMVTGFVKKSAAARLTAIALFALTTLKVFLFDMAGVDKPFRIVSFLVLGILLTGASFLYYRYRDALLPDDETSDKNEE